MNLVEQYEYHPFCLIFPEMIMAGLQELAEDIRENGLREPVILHEGKILDGRNRYRACLLGEVPPTFTEYTGTDPLGFVISHNLHRRHLNESQRALVASRLANMKSTDTLRKGTSASSIDGTGTSREAAAAALSVSTASLDRARQAEKNGVPELIQAVEQGKVSVKAAADVARLPANKQREFVAAGPDAVKAAAAVVRKSLPGPDDAPPTVAPAPSASSPLPKFIPDEGIQIADIAIMHLAKIHRDDSQFKAGLQKVINFCLNRLATQK